MPANPSNRLGAATSPYLLQHAGNPVDWWEWGEEAFAEARRSDRPVLLSVGYAACHWCHVMAHESFEDPSTAADMNRWFVNVKVDREERPDVDRVYMDAVQAATGRGGWPMTVFLTPSGEPFFAGTYYPPLDRHGLPGFRRVLAAVAGAWAERRDEVLAEAGRISAAVRAPLPEGGGVPGPEDLRKAYRAFETAYDPRHGGFGGAPKFPQAPTLEFLLRIAGEEWAPAAAAMVSHTLTRMHAGGIYDHLGGGFARYSVDGRWLVPHFEKMLYDNALLARLYLRAAQATGEERFTGVARETLDYLLDGLGLPDGGFASSEDADSEGEEGRYYVWTPDQVAEAAGEHAEAAAARFGVTPEGNFEGRTVLHLARPIDDVAALLGTTPDEAAAAVEAARTAMRRARERRPRPARDDKVVCAWNAMAVRALAEAGAVLDETRYLDAARRTARFVLDEMRDAAGRLQRSWREGRSSGPGFADDYAATAVALLTLYQATGEPGWYREAEEVAAGMIDLFWDDSGGGVHATGRDAEALIARPKNVVDNPTPSDNALAAEALSMLAAATGDAAYDDRVDAVGRLGSALAARAPTAVGHLLAVLASRHRRRELAVVGAPADPRTSALAAVAWERFRPGLFVAVGAPGEPRPPVPLLRGRPAAPDGSPQAYACSGFVCDAPTSDPRELRLALG